MLTVRDRVEEVHRQWKQASDVKQPRDITEEFHVKSKFRDLNQLCKVGKL